MFIIQQFLKKLGAGRGFPAPPPSCILQKCVFMHGSVFGLSSSFPYVVSLLLNPSLGTMKLSKSPSRKTGFLFSYLGGSNILNVFLLFLNLKEHQKSGRSAFTVS